MNNAEWYVDWFNSPYYHLLYNHRNDDEASSFIDKLCVELKLQPHSKLWDIACGKGRHAIAFNKKGFDVVGTDLSRNSIREASQFNNDNLDFFVHDMREPFRINYFDAAFNLFTSIGYFKNFKDNFLVFKNVCKALRPGGVFVIDFFNSEKIERSLHADYIEKRGALHFHIQKEIVNNAIRKRIEFNCDGKEYYFEEFVSLFKKEDFEKFAEDAGLKLDRTFGSYQLEPFEKKQSERLILIFKK
ncbi:MAG: methyltransferase domain-containing protein [Bacteroidota bacterium]